MTQTQESLLKISDNIDSLIKYFAKAGIKAYVIDFNTDNHYISFNLKLCFNKYETVESIERFTLNEITIGDYFMSLVKKDLIRQLNERLKSKQNKDNCLKVLHLLKKEVYRLIEQVEGTQNRFLLQLIIKEQLDQEDY